MATANPDFKLRNLECSICSDLFTIPKILNCLHSFCKHCLETCVRPAGVPTLICPLCRAETPIPRGVEGVSTNFHLAGLLEKMALMEMINKEPVSCELCDDANETMHRCFDCSQNICAACLKIHSRSALSSMHNVATLGDIRIGKIQPERQRETKRKCQKHEGEVQQYYCSTCKQLVCTVCINLDHCKPEHKCEYYQEAAKQCRHTINDRQTVMRKHRDYLKESLKSAPNIRKVLDEKVAQTIKDVQKLAANVIEKVKAAEQRLIQETEQLHKVRCQRFEEINTTVTAKLERLEHSLNTSEELTTTSSVWDFLSMFPIIEQDLKMLTKSPVDIPEVDARLSYLELSRNPGIVGDIDLGKLEEQEHKWELAREMGKGDKKSVGYRDVCFLQPDRIAIADYWGNRIVTYNIYGTKQNVFRHTKPWAIAAINGLLVVVENEAPNVRIYNKKDKQTCTFRTTADRKIRVSLRSVAVRGNVILVGDIKRKVVTEHHPDGSLIRTIAVYTPPEYIAVHTDDRLVVGGGDQHVDIVDGNGDTLFTIRPNLRDHQIKYFSGVSCHATYIHIEVGYPNSGHIHRFDVEGKFISCVADGLFNPHGITISPDNCLMAVADGQSVKVYNKVKPIFTDFDSQSACHTSY